MRIAVAVSLGLGSAANAQTAPTDWFGGARRVIERDCTAPQVSRNRTHIVVACAVQQAAEQPVYRTTVYRARDWTRVKAIPRCRNPQVVDGGVRCAMQSISAGGRIATSARLVRF